MKLKGPWGFLKNTPEDIAKADQIFQYLGDLYQGKSDPWGLDLKASKKTFLSLLPIYRKYFKVKLHCDESSLLAPFMAVSNHTGQIPIDGMLITMAFLVELDSPILLRGMVERFMAKLPFLGALAAKTGSVLGDRKNCQFLLKRKNSILVFPEGVRGISKPTTKQYELQNFSYGFYRLALESQTPILPIAVIGAEEMFPFVAHSSFIAKKLKVPAFPLSLNYIPFPSSIDIHIGKLIHTKENLKNTDPDEALKSSVEEIENKVKELIHQGSKQKRDYFGNKRR